MSTTDSKNQRFTHENLAVWNKAVDFAVEVVSAVENLGSDRNHYRLIEQVEAAASSISMNIAEGKGRFSKKEFTHFCYIARGSLYETMTLIEILKRKQWLAPSAYEQLYASGIEIARMLKGLINTINRR